MDSLFLERFVAFCSERGYKPSTTYKTVNNLVWFLNWSADKGYNVYREYRQFYKQMEVPEVKSSMLLFLRWDELMRLMEYRTDIRRIERARDLFCFMCFAGLRFSELQNLKKEDLRPGEIVVRKPGGGLRVVPMNRFALQIRQKYENKFYLKKSAFPSMSIITMNKYLRIGGMESGLDRKVPPALEGKPGLPLYSRLTAGIAVNTFISNALEMDVPAATIAGFTGVQNDSRVRKMRSDLAMEEMQKFNALPAGTPQKSYPSI
jgi:integrase